MNVISSIKKTVLLALAAALSLAAVPWAGVDAAVAPAAAADEIRGGRLERAWAHLQKAHGRQGRMLDMAGKTVERVQDLIDKAEAEGKNVAALQSALDAFEAALEDAEALHAEGGAIIAAHAGFDDAGKITDPGQAAESVRELAANLEQVRELIGPAFRALHEALHDFREANPRPAEPPAE